jgi:hypothetical protein
MSSVVISGDTSGTVSLTVPAVAGTNTATLPAATGTVMVSGNMPAFSAYRTGTQGSFASATYTKVQLNTKLFDTASAFDNTTNYRFQPTVAGYYQVNYSVVATGTALNYLQACAYKTGSIYAQGNYVTTASTEGASSGSCLMYLNGSTDYLELYAYATVTGTFTVYGGANPAIQTFLSASLVRAA